MKTLFFVFIFCILFTFLSSTIINVPGDQPTIQTGINAATNTDTVLVQPGTYVENINYNGKNITVGSLFLTTQDTIYISQTIIDGNQDGSVVTFESGEDSTTVLAGFTVINGNGTEYGSYMYGGGIYCNVNSSPSLTNITIIDNSADRGGGIYCKENSSPDLDNVTITGNSANTYGGGIYCYQNSNPSLVNVAITGNSALDIAGGGIACENSSNLCLENVIISGNYAHLGGGGIYCSASNPCLNNVAITDNSSDYGGGICCAYSSPILENVTITDNFSVVCGGISCDISSPSLINVTITNNSAEIVGGIYCYSDSSPSLVNCILWNDSPQEIYFYPDYDPNSITISYSDIEGGEAGIVTNNNGTVNWLEGNINEDPLFVGTGDDPYSLLEDSPCIDAGIPDTTGLSLPPWDIIGNLRIWDGDGNGSAIIDMGAYEYGAPPYVDVDDNIIIQTREVFLHQNYPNPFNPTTTISFDVAQTSSFVTLDIFNIKGQKVKTLVHEVLSAGEYSVVWNGRDSNGNRVSSGIYLYRLQAYSEEHVRKMLLLK